MEKQYWIRRRRAAAAMEREAILSQTRLRHCERAGRQHARAAQDVPFLIIEEGPSTQGEREALRIRPGSSFGPRPPRPRPPRHGGPEDKS